MREPEFPPLFSGRLTVGQDGPLRAACRAAALGCDSGLVLYDIGPDSLQAAIVFAPETPLRQAALIRMVCALGLQNALGALAPPEVAVTLGWDGGFFLNGGRFGTMTLHGPCNDPNAVPNWLVVALNLTLVTDLTDTGKTPDFTSLAEEGCADLDPVDLLEAWVRHTLVWINTWTEGGADSLHREWTGLVHGTDRTMTAGSQTGSHLGLDEDLGLLLKTPDGTRLVPVHEQIEVSR